MLKRLAFAILYVALMSTSVGVATRPVVVDTSSYTDDHAFDRLMIRSVFGNCGTPCVVRYNRGGFVAQFQIAADAIVRTNNSLVIDGDCYSACVIAADQIRSRTCITPRAAFHLHKAGITTVKKVGGKEVHMRSNLQDPPQSPDIVTWAYLYRGGYPADGFITMTYADAKMFWRTCDNTISKR